MRRILHLAITVVVSVLFLLAGVSTLSASAYDISPFKEKAELLCRQVLSDLAEEKLGASPAGSAGYAVFISVCDKLERASVYSGTGNSLEAAFDGAVARAENDVGERELAPVWVKADVVVESELISMNDLAKKLRSAREEFFRYGVAFDAAFETALLEEEMNGAKIYNYSTGGIDYAYLNNYLKKANRDTFDEQPEEVTLFKCRGWFCDEDSKIFKLNGDGYEYGRRQIERIDADFAKGLIMNASAFLEEQVQADGSFIYGLYPRFDNEIDDYNIVRHAGTIWALICRYRLVPSEELAEKIERTIGYLIDSMVYDDEGRAYLYEEKSREIKLGGCGIAVVALTEYMNVFQSDKYKDICISLGEGILTMLDKSTGVYYHVLNRDFSRKSEFRTIYYDGEATFALCRLYGLTENPVWLESAQSAVGHFIEANYTQYRDHWVAYSMNEITKYVTDRDYIAFALKNAQKNLKTIKKRDRTAPTNLELLLATFEMYDRLVQNGHSMDGYDFDMKAFLDTVYARVDGQLNGYFFPEYAMYMRNPERILDTFMIREDGFRVRIDDVQHNIGGYYLYCINYDKLVKYGMFSDTGEKGEEPDVNGEEPDLNGEEPDSVGEKNDVNVKAVVALSVIIAIMLVEIIEVIIRIKSTRDET